MRRAARNDDNQQEIVDALRACGFLVWILDEPCDLLVHGPRMGAFVRLLEVKDGTKSPSKRKLTPKQARSRAEGWPIAVVETVDEALAAAHAE